MRLSGLIVAAIAAAAHASSAGKRYLWKTGDDGSVVANGRIERRQQAPQPPITYNGGTIFTGPISLVFLLYGDHDEAVYDNLRAWTKGLGYSDWWRISQLYYQNVTGTPEYVSGRINGHYFIHDDYSLGKDISADDAIPKIITNAIKSHNLEESDKALYILYMAADVTDGGFCTQGYCGYHYSLTSPVTNNTLFYALIGDPTVCPGSLPPPGQPKGVPGCLPRPWRNTTTSINGNQHADGPMSAISHEVTEAITDRFGDAWFDSDGDENGDKCNGNYLTLQHDAVTGEPYNVEWDGARFLIQSNWNPVTQACSLGEPRRHDPLAKRKAMKMY